MLFPTDLYTDNVDCNLAVLPLPECRRHFDGDIPQSTASPSPAIRLGNPFCTSDLFP